MKFKKIEVEFRNVDEFDVFEHGGVMYLRLPRLICRVYRYIGNGLTEDVRGDFNAVALTFCAENYVFFAENTIVRPLKSKLKIFD